jgi:hypothetical protein
MAKAKKSEPTETKSSKPAAAEKKPAAKAPAKKAPAAKGGGNAVTGMPQIDTNFAAQSAAKMLLNRAVSGESGGTPAAGQAPKQETSTFRNLKDQLAKPKSAGLNQILGPSGEQKKSTSHFLNQQRGHNQTQGGFNKTGVPRRTNG